MKITREEFMRITNFVERKTGIHLEEKKVMVEGRLEGYLYKHGFSSFSEYMNAVESDGSGKMMEDMINILTTNHTYFMRENEHFEFFYNVVLPELKEKKKMEKDLRIWCGASSTGEEPYTLAMLIRDFFSLDSNGWDTTLLATDISTDVLRTATKGVYQKSQIEAIPDNWKRRYFKQIDDDLVEVTKEIKEQVLFRQFNLMSPLPFKKPLQVVFLRNVLIYFEKDTKNDLLQRIYDKMEPGGYLFVGTTESVDRKVVPFNYVCPSVYRK